MVGQPIAPESLPPRDRSADQRRRSEPSEPRIRQVIEQYPGYGRSPRSRGLAGASPAGYCQEARHGDPAKLQRDVGSTRRTGHSESGAPINWTTTETSFEVPRDGKVLPANHPLTKAFRSKGGPWDSCWGKSDILIHGEAAPLGFTETFLHDPLTVTSLWHAGWWAMTPVALRYALNDGVFRIFTISGFWPIKHNRVYPGRSWCLPESLHAPRRRPSDNPRQLELAKHSLLMQVWPGRCVRCPAHPTR